MLNSRMSMPFLASQEAETSSHRPTENGRGEDAPAAAASGHEAESAGATQTNTFSNPEAAAQDQSRLQAELDSVKAKLAETQDRMLRIAAEADNARKRWDKEREELRKYAISDFARELLPVIDAFDKAMVLVENAPLSSQTDEGKALASVIEGVQIVSKVFHDSIKKHGIERVPGKGQAFNPEYHNAIARAVDASVSGELVLEEFVSGYKIGDRVLRTAMVKVVTPD